MRAGNAERSIKDAVGLFLLASYVVLDVVGVFYLF